MTRQSAGEDTPEVEGHAKNVSPMIHCGEPDDVGIA